LVFSAAMNLKQLTASRSPVRSYVKSATGVVAVSSARRVR
jgi:hypothetical protein